MHGLVVATQWRIAAIFAGFNRVHFASRILRPTFPRSFNSEEFTNKTRDIVRVHTSYTYICTMPVVYVVPNDQMGFLV